MVYLRSVRIHIWDIWRSNIWGVYVVLRSMLHIWDVWRSNIWGVYVICVWTWSKCEDAGCPGCGTVNKVTVSDRVPRSPIHMPVRREPSCPDPSSGWVLE